MKKITLAFMALIVSCHTCFATNLLEIYQQSLASDPVFKQAYFTYLANRELVPQARAALLPQLLGTGFIARTKISPNQPAPLTFGNYSFNFVNPPLTYNSDQYSITLSQAVFNFQAWSQLKQAKASVKQAEATFDSAAQNLILRVAQAYFNVLQAEDTLRFTQAENRANKRQLDQATQRYKVGLEAITSVYEAQAAYDTTVAQEIADENNVHNQYENLRKLTNRSYTFLAPLQGTRLPLVTPKPRQIQRWVDTALQQNYNFLASRYALESARQNIRTKAAGNYPTVTLQANYTQADNNQDERINPPSYAGTNQSVALGLNFPAFQGGLVVSQTRQAKDNFANSSQVMEQSYRETIVNTRIAYNNVLDGLSKIKADRQAVISAANSASSTEAQFDVGTRTMVDVLTEQQKLFQSQTTLAVDQYAYINAILTLKYYAGTLSAQDILEINSWLMGPKRVPSHSATKKTRLANNLTSNHKVSQ